MATIRPPAFEVPEDAPLVLSAVTVVEALAADGGSWSAVSIGGLPLPEAAGMLRAALAACEATAE